MSKFSLESLIALGLVAGSTLTGCDAPPVPTVIPPVPGPTAQLNPDILKDPVCIGVGRGYGTDMVKRDLYRAANRDPGKRPFPSTQPVTIYTNLEGNGYSFGTAHLTMGDLASANLDAPADDGGFTTAVCTGNAASPEPEKVFIKLADQSNQPHIAPVCVKINLGETPNGVMQRAREKAGYAEEYDAFVAQDNSGKLGKPVLIGNLHELQGPIYAGRHACVTNWMDHLRRPVQIPEKPTSANPAPSKGHVGAGTQTRRG